MQVTTSSHRFISVLLWILLAVTSVGTFIILDGLNQVSKDYDAAQTELRKDIYGGSVAVVQLPGGEEKLNIPTWSLFQTGNIWTLVSKAKPIQTQYVPDDLVAVNVPHGDASLPMKISSKISQPLKRLVEAAKADDVNLAISSAYRSADDQREIMDEFIAIQGESTARQYVAEPGKSEHQSGLAVDFTDNTPACLADSDKCNLGYESILWLEANAHTYGFIQRYPPGTSSITGVATESWHYRYVGVALARAMHESNLTFDEFVELAR
jgi:D-alanyl-D-alanine carboxypeptidase